MLKVSRPSYLGISFCLVSSKQESEKRVSEADLENMGKIRWQSERKAGHRYCRSVGSQAGGSGFDPLPMTLGIPRIDYSL
jgi:hypothetical protein